jgi:hypothetical protein
VFKNSCSVMNVLPVDVSRLWHLTYSFDWLIFVKVAMNFIFVILRQQNGVIILMKFFATFCSLTIHKGHVKSAN